MPTPLYSWVPSTRIISGGYEGENPGTIPSNPTPTITSNEFGQSNYKCFYRDSPVEKNCSSTRVVISGHDEWNVEVDQYNNLLVAVTTVIDSVVRDEKIEDCGTIPDYNPDHRYDFFISLGRTENRIIWRSGYEYMGKMGTIAANISLGTYIFTIPPGGSNHQSSLYVRNDHSTHVDDPAEKFHDIFQMGIQFTNLLPVIIVQEKFGMALLIYPITVLVEHATFGQGLIGRNAVRTAVQLVLMIHQPSGMARAIRICV